MQYEAAATHPAFAFAGRLLRLIFDSVIPALWFLILLASRFGVLGSQIEELRATAYPLAFDGPLFGLIETIVSTLFVSLIVVLYVIRRAPVRRFVWEPSALFKAFCAFGGTYLVGVIAISERTMHSPVIHLIASLLIVGGTAFALAGLWRLRRFFGILPEVRGLVTSGPYAIVRHPLYVGEWFASFGILLSVFSPVTVGLFIFWSYLQYQRMLNEESVLTSVFPEYADYAKRVPRLPLLKAG